MQYESSESTANHLSTASSIDARSSSGVSSSSGDDDAGPPSEADATVIPRFAGAGSRSWPKPDETPRRALIEAS